VPILIIQGDSDPYGTVEQVRLAERECTCPVESLLLPGVGHAPQQEAPEAVLAAVQDFVARAFAAAGQEE
jgi:pimeloyl-ACP methyl ester carboxylesterase